MKKLLRTLTAFVCASACVFSLAACGGLTPGGTGNEGGGNTPTPPSGSGDSKERYQVTTSEWNDAVDTIYDGFTATVTAIEVGEEHEAAWHSLCEYPSMYEESSLSGQKSEAPMIKVHFDGNRLLCDWNDELEAHASTNSVFDSGFERVWNVDTAQYDYYCYLKNAENTWASHKLEVGTTRNGNRMDDNDDTAAYVDIGTKDCDYTVADPNAWWQKEMTTPFYELLTQAAHRFRMSGDFNGTPQYDEATKSYKLDKGVVAQNGVLYADEGDYSNNRSAYSKTRVLAQNFEIKFDEKKCLSVSYDAYILEENIMKAFSVEAVRNTDFVTLPDGGHGRGAAYADRTEAMENAVVVINGASQPTNFTKTISVTPDKNRRLTVGEEHTFKVTDTAVHIESRVYTGEKEWNKDYDATLWQETDIYESKEDDAVYYYSKKNGDTWSKQAEPAPDGVKALWKEIQGMRYNFLSATDATKDKPEAEKPTAPNDLIYDAENNVYWSPSTGYCIRLGENASWSRLFNYNEGGTFVFVNWVVKDMGTTQVELPQVG